MDSKTLDSLPTDEITTDTVVGFSDVDFNISKLIHSEVVDSYPIHSSGYYGMGEDYNIDFQDREYIVNVEIRKHIKQDNEFFYIVYEPSLNEREKYYLQNIKDYKDIIFGEDDLSSKSYTYFYEKVLESLDMAQNKFTIVNKSVSLLEDGVNLAGQLTGVGALERYNVTDDHIFSHQKSAYKIAYYIYRDFSGNKKLDPLIKDNKIEDIDGNQPKKPINVTHSEYGYMVTNISFNEEGFKDICDYLSNNINQNVNPEQRSASGTLLEGSRIEINAPSEYDNVNSEDTTDTYPIVDEYSFSIRSFQSIPFTPFDLIELETISIAEMSLLNMLIQNENNSFMVFGNTSSGKTTTLNALMIARYITGRVLMLEDTDELTGTDKNQAKILTDREKDSEKALEEQLRNVLRLNPDAIFLGETRGAEIIRMIEAVETGHQLFTTIHAENPQAIASRFAKNDIEESDIYNFDVLIQQNKSEDNIRRVENIYTVMRDDNDKLKTDTINYPKNVKELEEMNHLLEYNNQEQLHTLFRQYQDLQIIYKYVNELLPNREMLTINEETIERLEKKTDVNVNEVTGKILYDAKYQIEKNILKAYLADSDSGVDNHIIQGIYNSVTESGEGILEQIDSDSKQKWMNILDITYDDQKSVELGEYKDKLPKEVLVKDG